jgi:hypothetical protein
MNDSPDFVVENSETSLDLSSKALDKRREIAIDIVRLLMDNLYKMSMVSLLVVYRELKGRVDG